MSFNALQFLKDYSIPHFTEGNNVQPGWVNIRCILPGCSDQSSHGGFNPAGGYYNCWKCGGHSLNWVIRHLLKISTDEAILIENEYNGTFSRLDKLNKRKKAKATKISPPSGKLTIFHKKYLKKRGFDPEFLTKKYGLTATGPGEHWEKYLMELRIIIPIYDVNGRVISFQGRDITNKQELRYKGCPVEKSIVHYKHTLYNLNNCKGNRIGVVEGVPGVWRMGDGFASTFGTAMTEYQIKELTRYETIFFFFDPEPEAQGKAMAAAEKLSSLGKDVEVIELDETGRDPGDLSEKEARHLRTQLNF